MDEDRRTETRDLEYQLTEPELVERAKTAAAIEAKLAELEEERKAAAARFKYQKRELEDARRRLSKEVTTGVGSKEVECVWVPIWKQQEWRLQRTDNEEVIDSRTMTKDELQTSLPANDVDDKKENGNGKAKAEAQEKKPKRKPRKSRKSAAAEATNQAE